MRAAGESYISAAIVAAVLTLAVLHSRAPGPPSELRPLPVEIEHAVYLAAAQGEVAARQKAEGRFRGSPWSQDDEFHNKEAKLLRLQARSHRTTVSAMIDALDRGMHEHWSTLPYAAPSQKVLPCRPRLSY